MKQSTDGHANVKLSSLAGTCLRTAVDMVIVFLATALVLVLILLSVGLVVPMVAFSPLVFLTLAVAIPIGGIYRHVLLRIYLKRKLTPLFAGAAVALCTAMVIVVISVMGGFLQMMRDSARKLTGDVNIVSSITGFEHYEKLIVELGKEPQITAATPIIRTIGLLNLDGTIQPVPEVLGIIPAGYDAACGYSKTLHWKAKDAAGYPGYEKLIGNAKSLKPMPEWGDLPGMVSGVEVWQGNQRDENGEYDFNYCAVSRPAILTVLPLSKKGVLTHEPQVQKFIVVNEFKSGLYEVDQSRIFVPFEILQKMLKMEPRREEDIDRETGEPTGKMIDVPGRTTEITLAGAPGVTAVELADAAQRAVDRFVEAQARPPRLAVQTWEQRHHTLLAAVEKEKGLLTVLFGFISIVAVVLVAVIFYMIVAHKIRDIGTLRALGASRTGVATIFLGYGLAIGTIGAALGAALAVAIVRHLNEIQDLLYQWFQFKMWDPRMYYFERIPTQMNGFEVAVIIVAAVLSSLLGAVVPAILAARANPVDALRYE